MRFWNVMNWVAWGLCALIAVVLAFDFIKVEKEIAKNKRSGTDEK